MAKIITKRPDGSTRVTKTFLKPSRVKPEFAERVNINSIMKKYRMRDLPPLDPNSPLYNDYSEAGDFHTAMQITLNAEAAFAALPSEIRTKFQNDAGNLMNYLADPKNNEESVKLGLRKSPPTTPPTPKISLDDETVKKLQTKQKAKIVYEE